MKTLIYDLNSVLVLLISDDLKKDTIDVGVNRLIFTVFESYDSSAFE